MILFTLLVVLLVPSGGTEQFTIYLVDSMHPYCNFEIACTKLETNEIWLDIHTLNETDKCGRSPLTHELYHQFWPGEDIHNDCFTHP